MKYLIDTNVCVNMLRSRAQGEAIKRRTLACEPGTAPVCSVVRAEPDFGALRSGRPQQNLSDGRTLLANFRSLPIDEQVADVAGRIRAFLATAGATIGPHDLLIAATAVANDATLVTHNVSEFARVSELLIEDWQGEQ